MKKIRSMKKINYLFLITIFIGILTSCSEDLDDNFKVKLLTKVIEVNQDESTSTINFTYDGSKIETIESESTNKTFTYSGNLISKIIEVNKITKAQTTFDYIYTNSLLTTVISSDNYTLNYIHQSNGTVSYQKTTTDVNNVIILLEHGTLYFQNQNLIKFEKTLDNTGINIVTKKTLEFAYDKKVNPLKNITGFTKLLNQTSLFSSNNSTLKQDINSTNNLETETYISSLVPTHKAYNYDKDGYPKELISDEPLFENKNNNHVKSIYFYE
jgi:hypothetical protein